MPFGIGVPELVLVLVVALIVFGPRKLPELGSSLGRAMREFRRATSDMTRDLREGLEDSSTTGSRGHSSAALPAQLICVHCATSNPKQNKFCGACGKELVQPQAAVEDSGQHVICKRCASANPQHYRFCQNCGTGLGVSAAESTPIEGERPS